VISELKAPEEGTVCIQLLSMVQDQIRLNLPALPIRHFVLGKTWTEEYGKAQPEGGAVYIYPQSRDALEKELEGAKRIFMRGEEGGFPPNSSSLKNTPFRSLNDLSDPLYGSLRSTF
jgi:hypothetical protein